MRRLEAREGLRRSRRSEPAAPMARRSRRAVPRLWSTPTKSENRRRGGSAPLSRLRGRVGAGAVIRAGESSISTHPRARLQPSESAGIRPCALNSRHVRASSRSSTTFLAAKWTFSSDMDASSWPACRSNPGRMPRSPPATAFPASAPCLSRRPRLEPCPTTAGRPPVLAPWRGGRVVECTALEMRHRCKPIGGSNPSLSAK